LKKLLIIEDDTDAREMEVFTFENGGFEVIQTGQETTVEEIAALKPHVIIVGYQLKGILGNEICLKLKASDLTKHIPIILYSATVDIDKIAYDSCADGVVAKPFELEDFVYLVNRIALS
jgi:DNA-binding response OmpR family regulator